MADLPITYSIKVAIVTKVGRTYVDFQFLDRLENQIFRAPIPNPYAGRGGGIFAGIEKDSIILVAPGPGEKWYCVAQVPDRNFYFDLGGATDIRAHETPYPNIKPGEVILKSNQGSRLDLLDNGNIRVNVGASNRLSDIELSRLSNALFVRADNNYNFNESGRLIQGIIKRDLNATEVEADTSTINFLDSERYDKLLKDIGRFPRNEVRRRTTKLTKDIYRNPALAEKREIIYEYADSFNVKDFEKEVSLAGFSAEPKPLKSDSAPEDRNNRRTDVLNLNLLNFNHLIERIEGTVVDIYGNVLDINRNIIDIPPIKDNVRFDRNDTAGFRRIYDYHRRSIKLHYEINSRKPISTSEPEEARQVVNNAKDFSRWSFDVDGEGLTKINIPASSETGNIPVLGRYFTSRDPEDKLRGSFKDGERRDVRIKQFGAKQVDGDGNNTDNFAGPNIRNDNYRPKQVDDRTVTVGSAYHDLMNIANSIFESGALANPSRINGVSSNGPMASSINNTIGDDAANAGGRSAHINMDGSLEMFMGADTIDKKSLVIDTQGGIISHIGRDRNGRSIIQQTDGDIILQVGGTGSNTTDSRFSDTEDRPGRIEIHLNRPGNGTPQKILIDENGITFDIQGNAVFKSTGDMVLESGARLLLNGELMYAYGASNVEEREILGAESLIGRGGSSQFT